VQEEAVAGTGDPEFPKVQFPTADVCPTCRATDGGWNRDEVYAFLLRFFRPTEIAVPAMEEKNPTPPGLSGGAAQRKQVAPGKWNGATGLGARTQINDGLGSPEEDALEDKSLRLFESLGRAKIWVVAAVIALVAAWLYGCCCFQIGGCVCKMCFFSFNSAVPDAHLLFSSGCFALVVYTGSPDAWSGPRWA
jgi:hypothetical protein